MGKKKDIRLDSDSERVSLTTEAETKDPSSVQDPTGIKSIDKPWDALMKWVMEKGAQAFASLALPGVQVGDALNRELSIKNIRSDFFCKAYLNNIEIILHFEFQKKKHKKMDRRV